MLPFSQPPPYLLCKSSLLLDSQYFWYAYQQQLAWQYRSIYDIPRFQPESIMSAYWQSGYEQNVNLDQERPQNSNYYPHEQQQIKPVEISNTTITHEQHYSLKSLKKNRPRRKAKLQRRIYNTGHWTKKEHRLYLTFIEKHKAVFLDVNLKKQEKVFKQMSLSIKTRSPCQCRSHHQKFDPLVVT